MIYYTSDLHLGHKNIIKYENRPFKDIFDMTEGLIQRWNAKVKPSDIVYHLGDFAFKNAYMNIDKILDIYSKLNGKKALLIGNHDLDWINKDIVRNSLEIRPEHYMEIEDNGRIVVLCHYPIEDWDGKFHGSYHVHGHDHSQDLIQHIPKRYNCGVDVRNYEPVTLDEMIKSKTTLPGLSTLENGNTNTKIKVGIFYDLS